MASLAACDTYAPPITATLERASGRSNIAFDRIRYQVSVRMDAQYRQTLAANHVTTYVALSDCRTGTRIGGRVRGEIPQDDSRPIVAAFDLRPSSFNERHLCVELSGGTWRKRMQTRPTPITSSVVLD